MRAIETKLEGCYIFEPQVFEDERGCFFESYNQKKFKELTGLDVTFVQDNQSKSEYGVLRGLHLQHGEHAQAKLVRVLTGEVLDVAVDLRKNSSTYGMHVAVRLSSENKKQLFVPRGFAHGFIVLSESAEFCYKCDNFYSPKAEGGLLYNDPALGIDWGIDDNEIIIAEKDKTHPLLKDFKFREGNL
ncbi:dTDP-4-dehydrorhamnose 3,5-epimerase [Xanthovirga aplysinae]|uniref:dTDP-4-dehydrorhamnose 3,5-epimerase n=1 Tax=Xanthovirga aplysinae TaxID=2529853 RepID=UPI0012BC200A|nr:dTDP-4-dehydrorhamnose 3,5-epimerase [Xanthovirga aplysinae]MTI30696.1 dTDP-4-dehydrorhamnose 3,5-epimerase [Xanthovirga aplysinae]